jgi:cytochrome c peroxidase
MKKNFLFLLFATSLVGMITFSCTRDFDYDNPGGVDLKKRTKAPVLTQGDLTPMEFLGKNLFFDMNLSANGKMSCATCHAPETGFTGPISAINLETAVYPGTIGNRFGNRKPPTAAYGGDSPVMFWDDSEGLWIGGMFWDGRATGWTLGDPLAEQAMGPFLNPVEQAAPEMKFIVDMTAKSTYAYLFEVVYGDYDADNIALTYEQIARAIAAYERSAEVNPFSSKYDAYLAGNAVLTTQEAWGLDLFNDEEKGKCALCHLSDPGPGGEPPLFTDFTYDNLGIPKNPDNPFYMMDEEINPDGMAWIDMGLGGFLESIGEDYDGEIGKHKVPTLRNVDKRPYPEFVKAYGHNGYFKSLEEITHFYNTRDVPSENWPMAEVPSTVNTEELGDLGLTMEEEAAIVAFMKTLSDGYIPD